MFDIIVDVFAFAYPLFSLLDLLRAGELASCNPSVDFAILSP